eukprot:2532133-Rhodomonas_salina.2
MTRARRACRFPAGAEGDGAKTWRPRSWGWAAERPDAAGSQSTGARTLTATRRARARRSTFCGCTQSRT